MNKSFYLPLPSSAVLLSGTFFILLHVLSPYYHFRNYYSIESYLLFAAELAALSFCPIVYGMNRNRISSEFSLERTLAFLSTRRVAFLLTIFVFISFMGGLMRTYDIFVNRAHILLASDMDANEKYHLNRGEDSSTMLGLVSAALYPMAIPTMTLLMLQRRQGIYVNAYTIKMLALMFTIVMPMAYTLLLGKRSTIFSVFLLAIVMVPYVLGRRYSVKTLIVLGIAASFLVAFFAYFLSIRSVSQGGDIERTLIAASYTDLIEPTPVLQSFYRNAPSGVFRQAGLAYVSFSGYLTHGVPECLYLFDHCGTDRAHGYTSFNVFFKLAGMLGVSQARMGDMASFFPRPGKYTTLFGSLYLDFGILSLAVSFALGLAACVTHRWACTNPSWAPLFGYFYMVIFLAPCISFLALCGGAYYLTTFTAFGLAMSMFNTGVQE